MDSELVFSGTEQEPFYDSVTSLCETVERAVRDLRLVSHPRGFSSSDLRGIGPYDDWPVVEEVMERYLDGTRADDYVFGASRNPAEFRGGSRIFMNTSVLPFQVKLWQEYYGKISTADFWLANMQQAIGNDVSFSVENISSGVLLSDSSSAELGDRIHRKVSPHLLTVQDVARREVYAVLNIRENHELLYSLAFSAEAHRRGWGNLTVNDSLLVLASNGISREEFSAYVGFRPPVEETPPVVAPAVSIILPAEPVAVEDIVQAAVTGTSLPSTRRVLTFPAEEVRSVDFRGQDVVYIQMPVLRYGVAVGALVNACNGDTQSRQPLLGGIPRALTMRENFIARLIDPSLWDVYLDTCAGIAYSSADADAFKLAPVCPELARIPQNFNGTGMTCNYPTFAGIPLRKNGAIYNSHLDRDQFLSHEGWFTVLEGDHDLMTAAADVMYTRERRKAFGFNLLNSVPTDQIRQVWVNVRNLNSCAGGYSNLYDDARFLRVAQR